MSAFGINLEERLVICGKDVSEMRKDLEANALAERQIGAELERLGNEQLQAIDGLFEEAKVSLELQLAVSKCAGKVDKLIVLLNEKQMTGFEGYRKITTLLERLNIVNTPPLRRKRKCVEKERPQATTQIHKKEKKQTASSNGELASEIEGCFGMNKGAVAERLKLVEQTLANMSYQLTSERLQCTESLTTEEIKTIYHLFFETELKSESEQKLGDVDCVDPHPAFVIYSLFQCVAALGDQSCEKVSKEARKYVKQRPKSKDFSPALAMVLSMSPRQRNLTFDAIRGKAEQNDPDAISFIEAKLEYERTVDEFEKGLRRFPIISTRDVYRSNNLHETFVLRDETGENRWVFKPTQMNATSIPIAEHVASLVNYHHQFPIPLTISVAIGGWTGSAQLFIGGAKTRGIFEEEGGEVVGKDLQKLAIFDLLFANSDRHMDNILYKETNGHYRAYGIDHDGCLMIQEIKPLKLQYQSFSALQKPFDLMLRPLISNENLQQYEARMRLYEDMDGAIAWMKIAAKKLNEAMDTSRNVDDAIADIINLWEKTQDL